MQGKTRLLKFISALLAVCILLPLSLSPSAAADVAGEDSSISSGTDAGATVTETPDYEESKLETYPEIIAGKTKTDHIERLAYKEDLNTLVYANADGTETMYLFDCAVKYIDNNGNIKDKSTSLISTEDGFANRDNDIAVSFSGDASGGAKVSYNGIELTLIPQSTSKDISKAALSALAVPDDDERERVVYDSAFADAKLVYTPTFEGFKEDIVVDQYNGVTEYSFRLLTNGAVLKDNVLYCDGKEAAQLGDIIVIDSEGQIDLGSIKAETVKEGGEYLLTVCVNADFMKSAVYPVYIDPTIYTSGSGSDKTIQDAPVYSNSSSAAGGNSLNLCGYCGSSLGIGKVLYKFPGLTEREDYQGISAYQITSVILYVREASGKTGTAEVTSYPFLESWSESAVTNGNVNILDYNTSTTYKSTQSFSSSPNWWTFDLTQTAKAWRSGTFSAGEYGIILINKNEGTTESAYYRTFLATEYSSESYRPYIEFTYTPVIFLSHTYIVLPEGADIDITATTYPDSINCSWSVSSSSVAALTQDPNDDHIVNIDANSEGTAYVYATTGESSATCEILVVDPVDTGYYFIQNVVNDGYIGPYCDISSNGTSLYTYESYSTTNNNGDYIQPYYLYQESDGYCSLQSDDNNKYITQSGTGVIQDIAHSNGINQLWLVYETSGGILMIPKDDEDFSNQERITGQSVNSASVLSTIVSSSNLWAFESATDYGGAGIYNAVTYTEETFDKYTTYRCFGYALNDESVIGGGNIPDITSNSDQMLNSVFSAIRTQIETDLHRECRYVNKTSRLRSNEYRIAMKIGYDSELRNDVHYMKQLYDGTWAHKPGAYGSRHESSFFEVIYAWSLPCSYYPNTYEPYFPAPEDYPEDQQYRINFYDSNTIFFAVSISSYGG